ncbi:MAG: hypothetical protein ACPGRX_01635 [Bdellovibrionales bacterium]
MSLWFILWLLMSLALLSFMGWTFVILMRQKQAWKTYAAKRKLRFKSLAFTAVPEMSGTIGDHTISFFSSEHANVNARGSRKLTAIEINLNSRMPTFGGVASGGMVPIMKELNLKQEYRPKHKAWNKSYIAAANNRAVLQAYLTDARVGALCDVMAVKNAWVILIFRDESMLLRVDTPDPLDSPAKIDALVKQMLATAEVLELKKGESEILKSEAVQSVVKSAGLEIDEAAFDAPIGLELEEAGEETREEPQSEGDPPFEEKPDTEKS